MRLKSGSRSGEVTGGVEVGESPFVRERHPAAAKLVHQVLQGRLVGRHGQFCKASGKLDAPEPAEGMAAKRPSGDDRGLSGGGYQSLAKLGRQKWRVTGDGQAVTAPLAGRPGEGAGEARQRAGLRLVQVGDRRQVEHRRQLRGTVHRQSGAGGDQGLETPGDQRPAGERFARLVATKPARPASREDNAGDDHGPISSRRQPSAASELRSEVIR